jgi:hypothetical protein
MGDCELPRRGETIDFASARRFVGNFHAPPSGVLPGRSLPHPMGPGQTVKLPTPSPPRRLDLAKKRKWWPDSILGRFATGLVLAVFTLWLLLVLVALLVQIFIPVTPG